jgi:cardiolipin synthase A/B
MTAPLKIKPVREAGYLLGNSVRLIKGGLEYFNLMEELIDRATTVIYLQTYIFEADETGKRIINALIRAAKRKVKVFILLDGYASQGLPYWVMESFHNINILFNWFHPLFRGKHFYLGRRLHHKILAVDGKIVLTGGLNISDRYNDTVHHKAWLDYAILAEGQIGKEVQTICERKSTFQFEFKTGYVSHDTQCKVRPRINDSINGKQQIWNSYMEMFRKAKSHILIMSPYFMPGKTFRNKMKEAAQRGVQVRIILGRKSDVMLARYAEQFLYPWLLNNNIEIYEYQENILHGKIATYDSKWVTLGSYNVNNISAYASVEFNLDVENEVFAQECQAELTDIIEHHCEQITLERYQERVHWWNRFLFHAAYHFIRMILFIFTGRVRNGD